MIRKMITFAAAIAIPVSAVAAFGAVIVSPGVAAAKGPVENATCYESGTVTLAKPGLTHDGTLTKKPTETTSVSLDGDGAGSSSYCDAKKIALKIVSTTTACSSYSPPSSAPEACSGDVAKDPNVYDDAGGYAGSASGDIGSALPLKVTDNGTTVYLQEGTTGTISSGGACGSNSSSDSGFSLTGNVTKSKTGGTIYGTYADTICVVGDGGTGTSGNFNDDLLYDVAGSPEPQSTISSIDLGGSDSELTITAS
jgi:hypothetical protein